MSRKRLQSKRKLERRTKPRRPDKLHLKKSPRASLKIIIDMPDSRIAKSVRDSIAPETKGGKGFRSETTVSATGARLQIGIVASDIVALRTASNSFLHFVSVGMKGVAAVAPVYSGEQKITSKPPGP